jgi:glutamate synthase (NADPH/NADH) small chain
VPEVIDGSAHELPADMVIKALGFDPEDLPTMFGQDGLEVTRCNRDWRGGGSCCIE